MIDLKYTIIINIKWNWNTKLDFTGNFSYKDINWVTILHAFHKCLNCEYTVWLNEFKLNIFLKF